MDESMVLRSLYLTAKDDETLRQLGFDMRIPKSELIRMFIRLKLEQWANETHDAILADISHAQALANPVEEPQAKRASTGAMSKAPAHTAARRRAGQPGARLIAKSSSKG